MWLGKTNASKCIDTNVHTPLVLCTHTRTHTQNTGRWATADWIKVKSTGNFVKVVLLSFRGKIRLTSLTYLARASVLKRKSRWQTNRQYMAVCGGGGESRWWREGVKLGWGSRQMERWGRREGGGSKGYAEWYLQCAGCEACHLSSNRKPVCGWNWKNKKHVFLSLLTLTVLLFVPTGQPVPSLTVPLPSPSPSVSPLSAALSPVTYAAMMQFPTTVWSES